MLLRPSSWVNWAHGWVLLGDPIRVRLNLSLRFFLAKNWGQMSLFCKFHLALHGLMHDLVGLPSIIN